MSGYEFIRQMSDDQLDTFLRLVAEFGFLQGASAAEIDEDEWDENIYGYGCYQTPEILKGLDSEAEPVMIDGYEDDLQFCLPGSFVKAYSEQAPELCAYNGLDYPDLAPMLRV